ncbi:MAG: ATP-binding cassette domain-containing protein, partial [Mesorhizobium sp.]
DLGIVRKIADRVCVMTKGKIVETGPTKEIFANPQHSYTRHLLAAEPKGKPPAANTAARPVMTGQDIKVWFPIKKGFFRRTVDNVKAVDGIDVTVRAGQTLGVVGESGSGKSITALTVMRLLPWAARASGRVAFDGIDILAASEDQMCALRGDDIGMVFQEPMTALNPVKTIGEQV